MCLTNIGIKRVSAISCVYFTLIDICICTEFLWVDAELFLSTCINFLHIILFGATADTIVLYFTHTGRKNEGKIKYQMYMILFWVWNQNILALIEAVEFNLRDNDSGVFAPTSHECLKPTHNVENITIVLKKIWDDSTDCSSLLLFAWSQEDAYTDFSFDAINLIFNFAVLCIAKTFTLCSSSAGPVEFQFHTTSKCCRLDISCHSGVHPFSSLYM